MCGIFGYVTTRDAVADRVDLVQALAAMHHRGPDDAGLYEGERHGVRCGLAHARLSIQDLSDAAAQPMATPDGRYTLVFNGELYNAHELRPSLEARGVRFRSDGDTEALLEGVAAWGLEAGGVLRRVRGMFAFALWDHAEGTLQLARDPMGIKPLYVCERPELGGLAFASEVRTLLATGLAPRRLDRRGLESLLRWGTAAEPLSLVEGVRMLAPGEVLTWRKGGGSKRRRYWDVPLHPGGLGSGAEHQRRVDALPELVRRTVRERLVADVEVGVFLSGGIDSSAVTALAAEASDQPVRTFTVTFDEQAYDEAAYAEAVAERYGCRHQNVALAAGELPDAVPEAVAAYDQPAFDGVNTWLVSRAAREAGLVVCLSGLGGDEVFAGYTHFRTFARLLTAGGVAGRAAAAVPGAVGFLGRLARALPPERVPSAARKLAAVGLDAGDPARTYETLRALFTEPELARLAPSLLASTIEPGPAGDSGGLGPGERPADGRAWLRPELLKAALRGGTVTQPVRDAVNLYAAFEQTHYLRDTTLRATDVHSMAHALEVRVPLVDPSLVAHVAGIPGHRKLPREGQPSKALLVDAVGTLPRETTHRRKMGFTLPYAAWLRGPLRPWAEEHLLGESGPPPALVDRAEVGQLWRAFLRGERYVSHARLWTLAVLGAWCARHRVTA